MGLRPTKVHEGAAGLLVGINDLDRVFDGGGALA